MVVAGNEYTVNPFTADIPATVLEQYPGISQAEWDAVLRFVTMTLSAFESAPAEGN